MQDGTTRVKTDADYGWEKINFQMRKRDSYPENYKELYLGWILNTCDKADELYKSLAIWDLIRELYHLSDLFYGFKYQMKYFNAYAKENGLQTVSYCDANIPGSHNFNTFLNCICEDEYSKWENSEELLKEYYLPMVQIIREFAKAGGIIPPKEVLIATRKREEKNTKHIFSIYKARYIKTADIPNGSDLLLPDYYNLGAELKTPEEYHEFFMKIIPSREIAEANYKDFMEKEYPVFVYVKTHMWEDAKKVMVIWHGKITVIRQGKK